MKRLLRLIAPVLSLVAVATSASAQAQPQRVLGREDIVLYGIGLKVEPGYQTVPKDIATIVGTFLQAPLLPGGLPPFAADAEVRATLRGPSFQAPIELTIKPNTPFNIPPLTVPGAHVLENIRLVSGGEVLLRATPDHVTIDVIEKLLVTQVTARALTAAEIRERGIVFDPSNFQAYNFSAAFAIADTPINISFPVVLPRLEGAGDQSQGSATVPSIVAPSLPTLSTIIPDTLKIQTRIPNLSVVGFTLKVPSVNGQQLVVPPIPGVVVIPGDIGFLNQYFSVMLMVGNVAPAGSNLVVTNLKAEIVLPQAENPARNPLAMAKTAGGESPRIQSVAQPGPDGKIGTADDIPTIGPGESGNAEYLVEGRREGSHVVEMQISGTLMGLPVGPVTITGRAAGSVLVRNPNFSLTFTHPEVVSAGEPYTLDVTVTNTSSSPANLVSLNLYPRNVSGATIVGESTKQIDSLLPGDSTTVTFNLISKTTGKVTAATLDSDENVSGRFALKAAVGELGVPLSPDSLVLPKEANGLRLPAPAENPDELKQAALGLLGKAHAVATAPAAALPPNVRRFSRKIVIDRAVQVAEAGLRVTLGEPLPTSASQLLMDFMGSDISRLASLFPKPEDRQFEQDNIEGFDELRRRSVRGDTFAAAVARVLGSDLANKGAQPFLYELSQAWSYRPAHVAVLISGMNQPLPARFSLADAQGRRVGAAGADGKVLKEIPYSDVLDFRNANGEITARLMVLAAPQPGPFQINAEPSPGAPANSTYVVSIVAPDATGALTQTTSAPLAFPQRPAPIGGAGDPFVFAFGPFGGTEVGNPSTTTIVDPGPTVLAVVQQAEADALRCTPTDPGIKVGRVVAVLFSEEVTPASVQDRLAAADITNFAVDGNKVVGVALQPGRRIAFVALRDPFGPFIPRTMTVTNVQDVRGHAMATWSGPMQATVGDEGGVVFGTILNADGTPVPFANVRLFNLLTCDADDPHWVGISSKSAGGDGKYQFDFVTKLPDRLLAVNEETSELRNVRFNVQRNGQRLNVDVVFLGRGTFAGTTFDERGQPLANTVLRVSSLTDGSSYGATTNAAGRFTIPGVPVGNFFVEAVNVAAHAQFSFSDYMPQASTTVARDITLLDVEKRNVTVKHGAISGHVLRGDGTTPVAGLPVIVWYTDNSQAGVRCPGTPPPGECAIAITTSDGQGGFSFASVSAGELRVSTFDQGALSQGEARLILSPDSSAQVNVLLTGGLGTVEGIVLDSEQHAVAGARVGGGLSLTTTGPDGRFTLKDVPVGHRDIVAVSDTLGVRAQASVDIVQAGQIVNASIVFPPVGSVSGTVTLSDGVSPAANIKVYLFARDAGAIRVVGSATTSVAGGFQILAVPAGTYQLSAFNSGFTDGNIVPVTVKFQGQNFRTNIRFRGGNGRLTGTVFDDDGKTPLKAKVAVSGDQIVVAGNQVGIEFRRVQYYQVVDTDFTTGKFTLNNILVGPVTVSAVGQFSPDPISVETEIPAPNATVTVNLQLQATSQIKGVVLLPNGVQPAGANIVVKYKSDAFKLICSEGADGESQCDSIPQGIQEATVVTDPQGRFWFPVVNAGTFTITLEDDASGRIGTIQGSVKPGEVAELSARLFGRGDVAVKVLGSNATTAIAGAHVKIQQLGYPRKTFTFTADNTGTVLLTGGDALGEGAFVVDATDPSNGFTGRANGVVTTDGETVTVKVYLYNAAGTVSGTVFRQDGYTPVPNAEVIVSGPGGPLAFSVTGADGQYSVDTIPLGAVAVEIFEARTGRRGLATGRVDMDRQQLTINVVEAAIGLVKGQVLQQSSLQPLKGWEVTMSQQSASGLSLPTLTTTSGVDGAFSFPGSARGGFSLVASRQGIAGSGTARGAVEREGQVVEVPVLVNIVRTLKGAITGVVVDGAGAPVGNVALDFCVPTRCNESGLHSTAAADGTFSVSDIPLGRFVVVGRAANGDSGSVAGEVTFEGEAASVTLVLSGLAEVKGQVVHADGSPAGNVEVALTALPTAGCGDAPCTQAADGSGNFTFINIPGRSFTVTATEQASGLKGEAGGALTAGEHKIVRVVLGPTVAASGRVMTSSGTPAQGAVAELILGKNSGDERRLYKESAADGTFTFPAVPLGQYELIVSDPVGAGLATRVGTLSGPLAFGDIVLDEAPPQVASLVPAPASRGVELNQDVTITFTEPILPGTVNADSVALIGPSGAVTATLDVTSNDRVVVLHPLSALKDQSTYTVRVRDIKDRVQKPMPAAYVNSFTTKDVTRPTVVEASPAAGTSGVSIYSPIRIRFSEAVDTSKFGGAPITLTSPTGVVPGAATYLFGNTVAVFTPAVPLTEGLTYQVAVKKATDLSGLEQATAFSYAFKTTSRVKPTLADLVAGNGGKVIEGGVGTVKATPSPTSDVLFVDFYVNGVLTGTDRSSPFEFSFLATPQMGGPGATIRIAAIPTDTSGNRGDTALTTDVAVVADQPPAVNISVTVPGGTLSAKNGDHVTVTVQASDDIGLTQLGYRAVTGNPVDALTRFYNPAQSQKAETFAFNIPANAAPGSIIAVQASGIDTKGQVTQATPVEITVVDSVLPVVEITGATTGATLKGGQTTTVLVTANDLGGITNVTFKAGGLVTRTESRTVDPVQNAVVTSFSVTVPGTARPGQTLTLDAVATDRTGNVGTAARVILPIADTTAPTAAIRMQNGNLAVGAGQTVTVVVDGEDEGQITELRLAASGGMTFTDAKQVSPPAGSASRSFDVTINSALTVGTQITLTGRAVDLAGNVSAPASLTLTVTPSLDVTLPASQIVRAGENATVTVQLAQPAPAGGLRLDFSADDQSVVTVTPFVTFAAGDTSKTITLTGVAGGTTTVRALYQNVARASMTVTVSGGIVSGYVLDSQLHAVAGAQLTVSGGGVSKDAVSGPDGKYVAEGVPGPSIKVKAIDPVTKLRGFASGSMNAANGSLQLQVVLIPAGAVEGTVFQADQTTPAGANVRVDIFQSGDSQPLATTFTDADSHYEFPLVTLGQYTLRATAGAERADAPLTLVESGQDASVDLVYLGYGSLTGTVRNGAGQPVQNAALTLRAWDVFGVSTPTVTNADQFGRFSFAHVPVGSFSLEAKDLVSGQAGSITGSVLHHQQALEQDVVIASYGSIHGTVVRADGATIVAGAQVSAGGRLTVTDANGNYRFDVLPLGFYAIQVRDPGTRGFGAAQATLSANLQDLAVNVKLAAQGRLLVTVRDANGVTVPSAFVQVSITDGTFSDAFTATTGSDGSVLIERVLSGTASIAAKSGALAGVVNNVTVVPSLVTNVIVSLEPTGTLSGTVFEPIGQQPATSGLVRLYENYTLRTAPIGPGGSYKFERLSKGDYFPEVVDAAGKVRAISRTPITIATNGQFATRDFTMVGLAKVSGTVVFSGGQPAQDFWVTLHSLNPDFGGYSGTSTNAAGKYEFTGVPVGAFTVNTGDSQQHLLGEATGGVTLHGKDETADIVLQNNAITLPQTLRDGNAYAFDVQRNGSIATGSSAFGSGGFTAGAGASVLRLTAAGVEREFAGDPISSFEDAGRELATRESNIHGLVVTRKVFVPVDGYFSRELELLTNPGSDPITVDVRVASRLRAGASASAPVLTTSSGDATFDAADPQSADRWAVFSGASSPSVPARAVVVGSPGAALPLSVASAATGDPFDVIYGWSTVTVAPGQTVGLLHFIVQQTSAAAAQASAERLVQLPGEALQGLSTEELSEIVNFAVPPDGRSTVEPLPALNGTVTGTVFDSDRVATGGGTVTFRSSNVLYQRTFSVTAGADGNFSIATIPTDAGKRLLPNAPFTLQARYKTTQVQSPVVTGSFLDGSSIATTEIVFSNTGVLSGTVTRASNDAVTSGTVSVGGTLASSTAIRNDAKYRIGGLLPGAYSVTAEVPVVQGGTGVFVTAQAAIQASATTNLNLVVPQTYSIGGAVQRASAVGAPNLNVTLGKPGDASFSRTIKTSTGGVFTFADVLPGTYTLTAYEPQTGLPSTVTVTVVDAPLTNRIVTLVAVGSIDGTVSLPGSGVAKNQPVTLRYTRPGGGTGTRTTSTNDQGFYRFDNVPASSFTVEVDDSVNHLFGTASGVLQSDAQQLHVSFTLTVNTINLPAALYDANGFLFKITRDGEIANEFGVFHHDSGVLQILQNGGISRFAGPQVGIREMGGRQIRLDGTAGSLDVTRKVYVPSRGYFTRFVETFHNPTTQPLPLQFSAVNTFYSSWGTPSVQKTSSGDTNVSPTGNSATSDHWMVADDFPDADPFIQTNQVPAVAMVWGGAGAASGPDTLQFVGCCSFGVSGMEAHWSGLTVAPGATVSVVHFLIAGTSRAGAQAAAERLVQLPDEALEGLTDTERASIVNFVVPPAGTSTLEPLPSLDGTVRGHVYDSPGGALVNNVTVQLKSKNPIFGRTYSFTTSSGSGDGAFTFTSSFADPTAPRPVVVGDYTLQARQNTTTATVTADGTFATGEAESTTDVAFTTAGSFSGTLQRSTGGAVSGATVSDPYSRTATTGAGGQFTFNLLPPGLRTFTSGLNPPAGQFGNTLDASGSFLIKAGQTVSGVLAFPATGALTGVVRNATGGPVANTQVTAYGPGFTRWTNTNSSGDYRLDDLIVGTYQVQVVEPRTLHATAVNVSIADGVTAKQDLAFVAVGSLAVTVKSSVDQPIPGAGVWIDPAGGGNWTSLKITDGTGVALYQQLPAGTYPLRASHPQNSDLFAYGQAVITGEGDAVQAVVKMPAVGLVKGVLRTAKGVKLPGWIVDLRETGTDRQLRSVNTDSEGRFQFPATPAGVSMHIATWHPVRNAAVSRGVEFALTSEGDIHDEDLNRRALAQVLLTTTHSDGSKWGGLRVTAKDSADAAFADRGTTDSTSGQLTIYDITDGPVQFRFYDQNSGILIGTGSGTVAPTDDEGVASITVVLDAHVGVLSGTVYAADQSTKVPGIPVTLLNKDDGRFVAEVTTDGQGKYSFGGYVLGPGGFTVRARVPYFLAIETTASGSFASEGEQVTRDLTLPAILGSIKGTVSAPGVSGVRGAQVFAGEDDFVQVETSATGEYLIENFVSPLAGFTAHASIGGVHVTHPVAFTSQGATATVDFDLAVQQGVLKVRVFGGDHATPMPSTDVYLYSQTEWLGNAATNSSGVATFPTMWLPLNGLSFETHFRDLSYSVLVDAVNLSLPIDISMPVSVIKGTVTFANNIPVNRPTAFAEDGNGVTRQAFNTTTGGAFAIFGTAIGPFRLTVQDRLSGIFTSVDGEVLSIDTAVIKNLALPPTGTVRGTLYDHLGQKLAGEGVNIVAEGLRNDRWTYTNDDGVYEFTNVPVGKVMVFASPYTNDGQVFANAWGTLDATLPLTLDLHPAVTTVTGKLVRPDGTPQPDGWVQIEAFGGAGYSHYSNGVGTDSNGVFTFTLVPPGPFKITAYDSSSQYFAVANGTAAAGAPPVIVHLGTAVETDYTLTGTNGLSVNVSSDGSLYEGRFPNTSSLDRAYSNTYSASLNDYSFCCTYYPALDLNGRQVTFGPASDTLARHTRKIFMPESGNFVRYLEIVENPTGLPFRATMQVGANLYVSSSRTKVAVKAVDTGNTYTVLDDTWAGRTPTAPAVAHVFAGTGTVPAKAALTRMPQDGWDSYTEYQWSFTVPPFGKAAILHFGVVRLPGETTGATAQAQALVDLTDPEMLSGLSAEEKALIKNFIIQSAPGGGGQPEVQ